MKVENKSEKLEAKKVRKKRRKNLGFLKYLLLFVFVFFAALVAISHFVNSYSPKVDVAIGDTDENLTLSNPDTEIEMKTIDERLKWIQMEDEMPSVAIRETLNADDKELQEKKELQAKEKSKSKINDEVVLDVVQPKQDIPKPAMSDIVKQTTQDFRTAAKQAVIPAPIPALTKVYLGPFTTLDEAVVIQQKVGNDMPEIMPFVKSVNAEYIVQIGSFSSKDVANAFIQKAQEKGYSPKTLTTN